jgi:hypothetical protein
MWSKNLLGTPALKFFEVERSRTNPAHIFGWHKRTHFISLTHNAPGLDKVLQFVHFLEVSEQGKLGQTTQSCHQIEGAIDVP